MVTWMGSLRQEHLSPTPLCLCCRLISVSALTVRRGLGRDVARGDGATVTLRHGLSVRERCVGGDDARNGVRHEDERKVSDGDKCARPLDSHLFAFTKVDFGSYLGAVSQQKDELGRCPRVWNHQDTCHIIRVRRPFSFNTLWLADDPFSHRRHAASFPRITNSPATSRPSVPYAPLGLPSISGMMVFVK